jgi:hypothetical protein
MLRAALLSMPLLLLTGCALFASDRDVDEAIDVYTHVTVHPDFPAGTEAHPVSVYWRPSPLGAQLRIYGVTDRATQDQVIAIVQEGHDRYRWAPISVSFFEEDMLLSGDESDDLALRGFEKLLRLETVP